MPPKDGPSCPECGLPNYDLTYGRRRHDGCLCQFGRIRPLASDRRGSADLHPDVAPLRGRARHQAVCSCGWEGPRRQRPESALEDLTAHDFDLITAEATPGIIRTGQKVRIVEEGESFREGQFVGIGPDSADSSTQLLFVQIGAGIHAFPALETTLEPIAPTDRRGDG